MSDIAQDLDMFDVRQVFQLLGFGEIESLAIDNIYISGGGASTPEIVNPSEPVNRAPMAAIKPSVNGGPATLSVDFDASQSGDVNGDALTYLPGLW